MAILSMAIRYGVQAEASRQPGTTEVVLSGGAVVTFAPFAANGRNVVPGLR